MSKRPKTAKTPKTNEHGLKRTKSTAIGYDEKSQFTLFLQKKCIENNCGAVIIGKTLSAQPKLGEPWQTYPHAVREGKGLTLTIHNAYDQYAKDGDLIGLYVQYQFIPFTFYQVLHTAFERFNTLTVLKLQSCNLNNEGLAALQIILSTYRNIIDVNVDGNPSRSELFFSLLQDTSVKYLSLKACKLTSFGSQFICSELMYDSPCQLEILNLTGNYLDDTAVTDFVQMLRQNRKLTALILADNWITDVGCAELMSAFRIFPLTFTEIQIRRRLNLIMCYRKAEMFKQYNQDEELKSEICKSQFRRKSTKSAKSVLVVEKSKSVQSSFSMTDTELLQEYVNKNYVGNNKITTKGYNSIIEALDYQLEDEQSKGILYLTLDGNPGANESIEYEIIKKKIVQQNMKLLSRKKSKSK